MTTLSAALRDWPHATSGRRPGRGPAAGTELSRDSPGVLRNSCAELPDRTPGHDPVGIADDSDCADRVARVVKDRGRDTRFAQDRLVLFHRKPLLAHLVELLAQCSRRQRPARESRRWLPEKVADRFFGAACLSRPPLAATFGSRVPEPRMRVKTRR
jgi:hypothetical protein